MTIGQRRTPVRLIDAKTFDHCCRTFGDWQVVGERGRLVRIERTARNRSKDVERLRRSADETSALPAVS